jgi:hypothetical protein
LATTRGGSSSSLARHSDEITRRAGGAPSLDGQAKDPAWRDGRVTEPEGIMRGCRASSGRWRRTSPRRRLAFCARPPAPTRRCGSRLTARRWDGRFGPVRRCTSWRTRRREPVNSGPTATTLAASSCTGTGVASARVMCSKETHASTLIRRWTLND